MDMVEWNLEKYFLGYEGYINSARRIPSSAGRGSEGLSTRILKSTA